MFSLHSICYNIFAKKQCSTAQKVRLHFSERFIVIEMKDKIIIKHATPHNTVTF